MGNLTLSSVRAFDDTESHTSASLQRGRRSLGRRVTQKVKLNTDDNNIDANESIPLDLYFNLVNLHMVINKKNYLAL